MTFTQFPMQRELVLTSGNTKIGIMPDICLVSHFQVDNWPVLYRAAETGNVSRWGMPLMIPNFSQLKQGIFQEKGTTLPMHGFGRTLPWTVIQQDQSSATLQLSSDEHTRAQYPYEFTFTAHIVASAGTLTYTLTMENRNAESMPIAPGFHPYFTVAQADKATIGIEGLAGIDPKTIPWATQPPNNTLLFPHSATFHIPHHGILTIAEQPWQDGYSLKNMQVWSEPETAPDHNFVCFEPIVASADGLNRPADRINMAAHSTHQIMLQIKAQPR
jgi:galactose mutarotase-like enzyme